MSEAILACSGLQKTYRGPQDVPVLTGIDLEIAKAVISQAEFVHHWSGSEGDVVAVADVDGGTCEIFRCSGPTDGIASLDEQGAQTVPG